MPSPSQIVRLAALASGIAGAAVACLPSMKSTFADSAYPAELTRVPERDLTLSLDAALLPELVLDYRKPREVARCFELAARDPAVGPALWRFAECSAADPARDDCALALPWLHASADAPESWQLSGCFSELGSERDRVHALLATMSAARAWRHHQLGLAGLAGLAASPPADHAPALSAALDHAARLLNHEPAEHPAALPVLALSGGAANGAFVAGYLHALLWLREQARAFAGPGQRAAIDQYRFRAAMASSVGALVGLPLDLYFTDETPSPAQTLELDACIRQGGAPVSGDRSRKLQDCALAKLRTDFVKNEWELLCAQRGNVLDLTSPDFTSMLRFDPLEQRTLAPFFDTFGLLIGRNAFNRTVMTVDLEQNVLVGLDERACRAAHMDGKRCLDEAVMASIVEPLFVPARKRVYSGLRGPDGEPGTWYDGSLRSLNPTARAATFAVGKVLALNTSRAKGQPQPAPAGAVPIVLTTTDTLGAAQRHWETELAPALQRDRAAAACRLGRRLGQSELCRMLERPEAGVLSVWVPDDVAPAALFAKGYTFDPLVMRGLFLWGEKELLRTRGRVSSWLGWCAIAALESAGVPCEHAGASSAFAGLVLQKAALVDRELAGLQRYADAGVWREHQRERKALVEERLETCR